MVIADEIKGRLPMGILGLLVRTHYPGMVIVHNEPVPVTSFKQYLTFKDSYDQHGRIFDSKGHRVVEELWVGLSCTGA